MPKVTAKEAASEAAQLDQEIQHAMGQEIPPYQYPPLSLLREGTGEIGGEALGVGTRGFRLKKPFFFGGGSLSARGPSSTGMSMAGRGAERGAREGWGSLESGGALGGILGQGFVTLFTRFGAAIVFLLAGLLAGLTAFRPGQRLRLGDGGELLPGGGRHFLDRRGLDGFSGSQQLDSPPDLIAPLAPAAAEPLLSLPEEPPVPFAPPMPAAHHRPDW